ncbi:MAG: hypothetical protein AB2807_06785 [Candidatus Sedimenticola endophacoides]
MHATHPHEIREVVSDSSWHKLKHLPMILLGAVALYGLTTHHLLLVAIGTAAVLAFRYKFQQASGQARHFERGDTARTDGGAFGVGREQAPGRPTRPAVIDGGSIDRKRHTA